MSSPHDIEEEIKRTRAHLDTTLDAIAYKLSPMQMVSQVLSVTRAGGGDLIGAVAGGLASSARSNPLPTTLLAVGTSWLLMASRKQPANSGASASSTTGKEWIGEAGARMREKAHDLGDRAHHAAENVGEKVHNAANQAQTKAHDMIDRTQHKAEELRQQFNETRDTALNAAQENAARLQEAASELLEQNPIAAGALMVAIGALIGGALPMTEYERRLFGRSGEKVRDAAMKVMERGVEAVQGIAEKTLEDTKQTVEKIAEEARSAEPAMH